MKFLEKILRYILDLLDLLIPAHTRAREQDSMPASVGAKYTISNEDRAQSRNRKQN
mgnify:CR=1 FL=1